ncbi:exosortase K [Elusimicrobiota bacterium]
MGVEPRKLLKRVRLRSQDVDPGFVAILLLAAAVAYWLKRFYSQASVEELRWILHPTALLVSAAAGEPFPFEAGYGYVSRAHGFVIAPACAGINFLIVSACSLICALAGRWRTWRAKAAVLAGSFLVAYVWALAANTVRILIALAIQDSETALFLSPDRLHRVEGVVVYLAFLLILHVAVEYTRPAKALTLRLVGLPLGVYLAVTILVPLLNGVHVDARFLEHAATTLIIGAVISSAPFMLLAGHAACKKDPG